MFESLHGRVREICPKTGEEIPMKVIPIETAIRHFVLNNNFSDIMMARIKKKIVHSGVQSLTEGEINYAKRRRQERKNTKFQ